MLLEGIKTIATPPGYFIREQLENRGLSQKEFAIRLGVTEKHLSNLLNGYTALTGEMAYKLEMVLGIPASFWMNLENIYVENKIKVKQELDMEFDKKILTLIPYAEMNKNHWIETASRAEDKVVNLRKYFEVAKLQIVSDYCAELHYACRSKNEAASKTWSKYCYIQKARVEARNIDTSLLNLKKLSTMLRDIKKFTHCKTMNFIDELTDMFASCGIALVVLPALKNSGLHAVSFNEGKKIVLAISPRGKYSDIFWFSLFHELGHIIEGHLHLKMVTEKEELEADEFARNTLIDEDIYQQFIKKRNFSRKSIEELSKILEVDSSIVVGRLQRDNYIRFTECTDMKWQYSIPEV